MNFQPDLQVAAKLVLAGALGGVVGLEREVHRKPAGLRTNLLMCMGSALFTVLSQEFARRFGGDHARIAAQILPGIGFIGAGAVLRERGSVAGLTTAATVFVVASVGMAVGVGLYATSLFATVLILGANTLLGWVEERFGLKTHVTTFRLVTKSADMVLPRVHEQLNKIKLNMRRFQSHTEGSDTVIEFDVEVSHRQQQELTHKLSSGDVHFEIVPLEAVRE